MRNPKYILAVQPIEWGWVQTGLMQTWHIPNGGIFLNIRKFWGTPGNNRQYQKCKDQKQEICNYVINLLWQKWLSYVYIFYRLGVAGDILQTALSNN